MPITSLVFVIVLAGLLGGLSGVLTEQASAPDKEHSVLKHLVHGVVAAFCVPLFLSLVGNGDVSKFLTPRPDVAVDYESLLRIAGFCLVASVFSAKFMESLSNRVFALENKVRAVEDTAQATQEATETLEAVVLEADTPQIAEKPKTLAADHKAVLQQFGTGLIARSAKGISMGMDKSEEEVAEVLRKLQSEGLVDMVPTRRGERWKLLPQSNG